MWLVFTGLHEKRSKLPSKLTFLHFFQVKNTIFFILQLWSRKNLFKVLKWSWSHHRDFIVFLYLLEKVCGFMIYHEFHFQKGVKAIVNFIHIWMRHTGTNSLFQLCNFHCNHDFSISFWLVDFICELKLLSYIHRFKNRENNFLIEPDHISTILCWIM